MMQPDLYEMIFKRKSIRKYDETPLDDATISGIEDFIKKAEPLNKDIKTEISIVPNEAVTVFLPVNSPQYLVMTSEKKEGYLTNAGYILEQVDLFLSSKGIGSCYVGMAQPTKETRKNLNLEFVIIVAFGKPGENLHRTEISEFKRKSLSEITNIAGSQEFLEPVRIAPSATNSQPWFFTGGNGVINLYCVKSGFLKSMVYDKMNKIDMGIALCHLALSVGHSGKNMEIVFDKAAQEEGPKGYYYINTAILK